ncbi:MAG TPA: Ig domain-containing protein [Gemmatimonadales bacterium]|jgi:hypothetical protein
MMMTCRAGFRRARPAIATAALLLGAGCDYPTSNSAKTYAPPSSPAPVPQLPMITTTSLPAATAGQPYSVSLTVTGGILPYAYTITSGALPPGLSLGLQTGAITGTPADTGAFTATFRVATGNGLNERALTLTVQ